MKTLNRRASAIPYSLHAQGRVMNGAFRIDLRNDGRTAAEFQVQSRLCTDAWRSYTVEAGNSLCGWWEGVAGTGEYDLTVHGPNGFFRHSEERCQEPTVASSKSARPTTFILMACAWSCRTRPVRSSSSAFLTVTNHEPRRSSSIRENPSRDDGPLSVPADGTT
jgi:hypothetical protein